MVKTAKSKRVEKQTATFAEFGQSGLKRQTGFVREEFLPELRGLRGLKIYNEMASNDNIVRAMLFAIEMMIRSVEWDVEPASEEPEDLEQAEFLEGVIDDMSVSWVDMVADVLSFLPFGWSFHEIVYKRREGPGRDPTRRSKFDDGKIGWRKIPIRAQDTLVKWQFDDSGGIDAMVQRVQGQVAPVVIPIEKALLFRTSTQKQSPEGPSILRGAYRAWFFKKRIEEIESIGIERDLAGFPIIYVPPGIMDANASAADKALFDDYQNIIRNIRRDEQEGLILPGSRDEKGHRWYELTLLSTSGRRQFDTAKILERYSRWIAMVVLADFILLGHEKVGSFSLSSDKTALFATALGAWLDSIAAVFNDHGIPRLFALNGVPFEHQPTLVHGDIESVNLTELGKWLVDLASAGIDVTDENTEAWFRRLAGMPDALREEDGADGEEEEKEPKPPADPDPEDLEEDARRQASR